MRSIAPTSSTHGGGIASLPSRHHRARHLTNRCPPQADRATRCAAETISSVQCLLFVRVGVASPQLSSTVRPQLHARIVFLVLMGCGCTSDPPVAPDTHLWRKRPACGAKYAGIVQSRHRRSELWVAGSVRPRRCGWCPTACRSALRAQHPRKGELPIIGVGRGGLPRRLDPALSPLSGAWPPTFVARVVVAEHSGHLW